LIGILVRFPSGSVTVNELDLTLTPASSTLTATFFAPNQTAEIVLTLLVSVQSICKCLLRVQFMFFLRFMKIDV